MSLTDSKPTLVFVHGAWHRPAAWDSLRAALEVHGFETHAVDLPSSGLQEDPPKDHLQDVAVIRSLTRRLVDEGKSVILVPHSYGGVPGSSVVEGLEAPKDASKAESRGRGGVIGVFFIDAIIVMEGQSSNDTMRDGRGGLNPAHKKNHDDNYTVITEGHKAFYNDVSLEEALPLIEQLRPQANAPFAGKVSYAAWKHVPCAYVSCTNNEALPQSARDYMIGNVIREAKYPLAVHEIHSSHTPWLRHKDELVELIRSAAAEWL